MIGRRTFVAGGTALALTAAVAGPARANKAAVEIEAPEAAAKGSEVTVKLKVSHRGNTAKHHVSWVALQVNGEEVKRWEYSKDALPAGDEFAVEHAVKAVAEIKLTAEANCNIHGSAGPVSHTVKLA